MLKDDLDYRRRANIFNKNKRIRVDKDVSKCERFGPDCSQFLHRSLHSNDVCRVLRRSLQTILLLPGRVNHLLHPQKGVVEGHKQLVDIKGREDEPEQVAVDELIHAHRQRPDSITVHSDEASTLSGMPEEHVHMRRARIYKPAREATQTAWNNTKLWKIELENRDRWENPNIGWASSADPMSSLGMHMKFARREDAVAFCEKNGWAYEVVEPQERVIRPKSYGENFHWSKKTRIGCK